MKKIAYESPKFEFQELELMERVANTCWGHKTAYYDENGNKVQDATEIVVTVEGNSCNEVARELLRQFALQGITAESTNDKHFCAENTQSTAIKPVVS